MKVVSIESDNGAKKLINRYFEKLKLDGYSYGSFDEFFKSADSGEINVEEIKFLFVAVQDENDDGFKKIAFLGNKISAIVIFVLTKISDKACIKSLKYGAGYIIKSFSSSLLSAKINHHIKYIEVKRLLENQNKNLMEYKKNIDSEFAIVESIFYNHFKKYLIQTDYFRFHISPASVFNGDVLLSADGPKDNFYLAVGDVTGHGLPAAIGALPVYSTFRTMAKKGLPVGELAAEMNRSLRTMLPNNMMMALTLVRLDFSNGSLEVWSGGMPDVVVVDENGGLVRKIPSRHSPLAMLEPDMFRRDIDIIQLENNDRLFFYTDGIEETRCDRGEYFGSERLLSLFTGDAKSIFPNIIQSHKEFSGKGKQDDDITLVEVVYRKGMQLFVEGKKKKKTTLSTLAWSMSFSIMPEDIRKEDPLAQIIHFLKTISSVDLHRDYISTILSELFNNAVDHGLLDLQSVTKDTPDGFIEYYVQRSTKIQELTEGQVTIKLDYKRECEKLANLLISVSDTGNGFDHEVIMQKGAAKDNLRGYGHGLNLISNLCSELHFEDGGRRVIANYVIAI